MIDSDCEKEEEEEEENEDDSQICLTVLNEAISSKKLKNNKKKAQKRQVNSSSTNKTIRNSTDIFDDPLTPLSLDATNSNEMARNTISNSNTAGTILVNTATAYIKTEQSDELQLTKKSTTSISTTGTETNLDLIIVNSFLVIKVKSK